MDCRSSSSHLHWIPSIGSLCIFLVLWRFCFHRSIILLWIRNLALWENTLWFRSKMSNKNLVCSKAGLLEGNWATRCWLIQWWVCWMYVWRAGPVWRQVTEVCPGRLFCPWLLPISLFAGYLALSKPGPSTMQVLPWAGVWFPQGHTANMYRSWHLNPSQTLQASGFQESLFYVISKCAFSPSGFTGPFYSNCMSAHGNYWDTLQLVYFGSYRSEDLETTGHLTLGFWVAWEF